MWALEIWHDDGCILTLEPGKPPVYGKFDADQEQSIQEAARMLTEWANVGKPIPHNDVEPPF